MQVKGQSACQLKWKVVTLLVSLCVFIEETKGQVTCTYQQIADTSVDDNYREYELFFNTQSACEQLCSGDSQCQIAVYQDPSCRIYYDGNLGTQSDGGWTYLKKLSCSSATTTTTASTSTTSTAAPTTTTASTSTTSSAPGDTSDFFLLLTPLRDTECGLFWDNIRTFGGARVTILLPCKFLAARLISDVVNTTRCVTSVSAFGVVSSQGVYTGGAEIAIQISRNNIGTHGIGLVITDGILQIAVSSLVETRILNVTWGISNETQVGGVTLKWIFNGPHVTLSAPVCGVSLVYKTISVNLSEIIIQTASRRYISPLGYLRDYALCGNRTDGESMFEDDRVFLKLDSTKEVIGYRMLSSPVQQNLIIPSLTPQLHPNSRLCENASTLFVGCGPTDKDRAINTCLGIFSKRRLLTCLSASGATYPMIIFNSCLSMMCNPSSANCNLFKTGLGPCIEITEKPPTRLWSAYRSPNCSRMPKKSLKMRVGK